MVLPELREIFTSRGFKAYGFIERKVNLARDCMIQLFCCDSENKKIKLRQLMWGLPGLWKDVPLFSLQEDNGGIVVLCVSLVFTSQWSSWDFLKHWTFWMSLFLVLILMEHLPWSLGVKGGENRNEAKLLKELFK